MLYNENSMCPRQRTQQQRDYRCDSQCKNTCQVPKIGKPAASSRAADAVPPLSRHNTRTGIRTLRTPRSFVRCCPSSSSNLGSQAADRAQDPRSCAGTGERAPQLQPAPSYLAAAEDIGQGHLHVEVLQDLHGLFLCLF